jgi:hypothetical protein
MTVPFVAGAEVDADLAFGAAQPQLAAVRARPDLSRIGSP